MKHLGKLLALLAAAGGLLALTVLIPLGLLLYGSTELFLLLGVLMLLMGGSVIAGIQARILLPIFRQHENEGGDPS